jgi:hypothetical protein
MRKNAIGRIMAQKKMKKLKAEKPKKPAKPASKSAPVGGLLKKAAKVMAKKVTALATKPAAKKIESPKKLKKAPLAVVAKKGKEKVAKKAAPLAEKVALKGKKPELKEKTKAPVATTQAKPAGKKAKEVVVEVLAPKVVPLLTKEGKKKAKAAEALKKKCREPGCEHDHTIGGFCRLHYIKNWKKIKRKEAILASGQLNNYVEELVSKYPDRYLDVIRQDLASEKDWSKVVVDLELDSADEDGNGEEDLEGVVAEGVGRGREFDDEGDAF